MEILNNKIISFILDKFDSSNYDNFNFENLNIKIIINMITNFNEMKFNIPTCDIVNYMTDEEKQILFDLRKYMYAFIISNEYKTKENKFNILMLDNDKRLNDILLNYYTYSYCLVFQDKIIKEIQEYYNNKVLLK